MGPNRLLNLPLLALSECFLLTALVVLSSISANAYSTSSNNYDYQRQQRNQPDQRGYFAARRAADDSRPLSRVHLNSAASQESPIIMGKFKAPAPERIQRQRVPKQSEIGSQTVSASYRVAANSDLPEKVVHGIIGGSAATAPRQQAVNQRTVSAKMLVSDEGLNYPPSKLSADIYGNVAEIVTAPPEAVESDFLVPQSNKFSGSRRSS